MIIKNNNNNWKNTKEVAEALGIAPNTIIKYRNNNPDIFEGLVMNGTTPSIKGVRKTILWSDESIRILIKNLPTIAKEWKDSIKDEFMEKGIVLANMSPNKQMVLITGALHEQAKNILVLEDNIIKNRENIGILEDKMDNTIKFIKREKIITQKTLKEIRDGYTWIAYTCDIGWDIHKKLKDKFQFSAYKDLTEYEAKKILAYIKNEYKYKTGNYQNTRNYNL